MQPTPPGWYLDPFGRPALWRWFTGRVWTDFVSADPTIPRPTPMPVLEPDEHGRVHGGGLTFPVLPEDLWRPASPYLDADDETGQEMVVAASGRGPYVACVFLAALPERFDYTGPSDLERTGTAFTEELIKAFYPHEHPRSRDVMTDDIDGRPAWRTEVALDIDDQYLSFTNEYVLVALVDVVDGDGQPSAGVAYASLPEVDAVPSVADVLGQLGVA